MSLPTLVGRDGRRAIPAFTCSQALARWRQQARPVPEPAAQVWRAAAEDACAVIVDVAGPVPIAIDGARLAALAEGTAGSAAAPGPGRAGRGAGREGPPDSPAIAGLSVAAADGSDLQINVCSPTAVPRWQARRRPARRQLGAEVMACLGWPAAAGHRGRGDPRARLAGALNMAGSARMLRWLTAGESHGRALVAICEGVPGRRRGHHGRHRVRAGPAGGPGTAAARG